MMKRSHNRKPLRMLLGSAMASEARVRQQYGIENEITIEFPPQARALFRILHAITARARLQLVIG